MRAYAAACMTGIWPDIDTHVYLLLYRLIWPTHTVCDQLLHVPLASGVISDTGLTVNLG